METRNKEKGPPRKIRVPNTVDHHEVESVTFDEFTILEDTGTYFEEILDVNNDPTSPPIRIPQPKKKNSVDAPQASSAMNSKPPATPYADPPGAVLDGVERGSTSLVEPVATITNEISREEPAPDWFNIFRRQNPHQHDSRTNATTSAFASEEYPCDESAGRPLEPPYLRPVPMQPFMTPRSNQLTQRHVQLDPSPMHPMQQPRTPQLKPVPNRPKQADPSPAGVAPVLKQSRPSIIKPHPIRYQPVPTERPTSEKNIKEKSLAIANRASTPKRSVTFQDPPGTSSRVVRKRERTKEATTMKPINKIDDNNNNNKQEDTTKQKSTPDTSTAAHRETDKENTPSVTESVTDSSDPETGVVAKTGFGSSKTDGTSNSQKQDGKSGTSKIGLILMIVCLSIFVVGAVVFLVIFVLKIAPNLGSKESEAQITLLNRNKTNSTPRTSTDFAGNMTTTQMSPYSLGCDFQDSAVPHVASQCYCTGEIAIVTADVREKYFSLNMLFISLNISTSWNLPADSCDARNQALVWLSTTYAKDKRDLVEKFALASLFFHTKGTQWKNQDNWLQDQDVCTWYGVDCYINGRLKSIRLDDNDVAGSLSEDLALIEGLQALSLRQNSIGGSIPERLLAVSRIQEISLSANKLVGSIPKTTPDISQLQILRVDSNTVTGDIPTQLGQATMLKDLSLNNNDIAGLLPTELNQLTSLVKLSFENNKHLWGRLPMEYGLFTNLKQLSLSNTQIRGRLPNTYGSLKQLQILIMAKTQMSGEIPTEIGLLQSLTHVDLSGSSFRRSLPTQLGELTNLNYLALHDNSFTGAIPTTLGNLKDLIYLSLNGNSLSGEVPDEFGELKTLDTLSLQKNLLTGRVPQEVCNLRRHELISFIVDCTSGNAGIVCPVPSCCTSCLDFDSTS